MNIHQLNPLDKFQSYSFHYIGIASNTTEDVRVLTEAGETEALEIINNAKFLGDQISTSGKNARLIFDTRRFSQFTVDDFDFDVYTGGATKGGSINLIGQGCKFTVTDTEGVAFSNFLQYIMDKELKVGLTGMTFLLKVIIVGHNASTENGIANTETIDVLSFPLMIKNITMDLVDSKGIYQIDGYPLTGPDGTGLQKWASCGTTTTIKTDSTNTLGSIVLDLESKLNEDHIKRYNSEQPKLKPENGDPGKHFGRPIQYMITIPEQWENYKFGGPAVINQAETSFPALAAASDAAMKNGSTVKSGPPQKPAESKARDGVTSTSLSIEPETPITGFLNKIFSQTPEIAKMGVFTKKADAKGNITFYKMFMNITSDIDSFTVHIDVCEFSIPNVSLEEDKNKALASNKFYKEIPADPKTGTPARYVPKQYLEYTYNCSGTNSEVLSFAYKLEGLYYMLLGGDNYGNAAMYSKTLASKPGEAQDPGTSDQRLMFNNRQNDPVFPSTRTGAEKANFTNYNSTASAAEHQQYQQYLRNLASFYSMSGRKASIEIIGNPTLLRSTTLRSIPPHVSLLTSGKDGAVKSSLPVEQRKAYRKVVEDIILSGGPQNGKYAANMFPDSSIAGSPLYVRVDVFGANTSVNGVRSEKSKFLGDGDFSSVLFVDNYFIVNHLSAKFSGAKFTQVLDMNGCAVFADARIATNKTDNSKSVKEIE